MIHFHCFFDIFDNYDPILIFDKMFKISADIGDKKIR